VNPLKKRRNETMMQRIPRNEYNPEPIKKGKMMNTPP
jgi:hypothetical protein